MPLVFSINLPVDIELSWFCGYVSCGKFQYVIKIGRRTPPPNAKSRKTAPLIENFRRVDTGNFVLSADLQNVS